MNDPVYLVDGTAQIYRAFYAIRGLTAGDGRPTNAVYGFTQMLLKLFHDKNPKYLGMAFDVKGEVFRDKLYDQYKANRKPMPDDLVPQIPYIKDIVRGFSIPVLEREGFEADDVIGTLAKRSAEAGYPVLIVSRDKDMMQLVDEFISVYDPMSDELFRRDQVIEKFGVTPEQMPDFLGLAGDASDNIPGVTGIGPKTALKLLSEYGSIEKIYQVLDSMPDGVAKVKLTGSEEKARQSRELATIRTDLDLGLSVNDLSRKPWMTADLRRLFLDLGFKKFLAELESPPHGLFA
ncbi:MAG: hypothetical protein HYT87_01645 [Nitrospirae bacterium]|nr:hypothetical protein [Nitrospirota bacterium]